MSLPNSLRRFGLHDEVGRSTWTYSDLLNNAVRAQKRGTQVQPQPHEDRAQFEWGLQLQELAIACGIVPVSTQWWTDDPQDVKRSDEWYRDCEKVDISFHHRVKKKQTTVAIDADGADQGRSR